MRIGMTLYLDYFGLDLQTLTFCKINVFSTNPPKVENFLQGVVPTTKIYIYIYINRPNCGFLEGDAWVHFR